MVEVAAPDGTKSLWAAAVAPGAAVTAVKKMIPPNHVAKLSNQWLPISPRCAGARCGKSNHHPSQTPLRPNQLAKSIRRLVDLMPDERLSHFYENIRQRVEADRAKAVGCLITFLLVLSAVK
jgi:hypothetical protein